MKAEDFKIKQLSAQIAEWATVNNNKAVSYTMIVDMIKTEIQEFQEEWLHQIIYELSLDGITVEPFDISEDYKAVDGKPNKFIPADVNIGQKPMTVYNLMERLIFDEIDLQPGFQRRENLWDHEKQSRLIESLMLKIPLPAFYFDASSDKKWVVIDGLQRLSSFKNYLVGTEKNERDNTYESRLKFQGMQYLKEFDGLTFDDLPRQYIRRIKETPLTTFTVEKGTPDEVVFNIFQRINTGGLRLEDQEIRHALYQGKGTELTQKLADCEEFLQATRYSVSPYRMLDREYINRFLAFTELDYKQEYSGNIDNFLIKALKRVNTYSDEQLEQIENSFRRIMRYSGLIFEKYAFRKYNSGWRRGPINKALFELWSICFYNLTDEELNQIVKQKDRFLIGFQEILSDNGFLSALRAGDPLSFIRRVEITEKFIKEFLCLKN